MPVSAGSDAARPLVPMRVIPGPRSTVRPGTWRSVGLSKRNLRPVHTWTMARLSAVAGRPWIHSPRAAVGRRPSRIYKLFPAHRATRSAPQTAAAHAYVNVWRCAAHSSRLPTCTRQRALYEVRSRPGTPTYSPIQRDPRHPIWASRPPMFHHPNPALIARHLPASAPESHNFCLLSAALPRMTWGTREWSEANALMLEPAVPADQQNSEIVSPHRVPVLQSLGGLTGIVAKYVNDDQIPIHHALRFSIE